MEEEEEMAERARAAAEHLKAAHLLLQQGNYRFAAFMVGVALEALREAIEKQSFRPPGSGSQP